MALSRLFDGHQPCLAPAFCTYAQAPESDLCCNPDSLQRPDRVLTMKITFVARLDFLEA